MALGFRDSEALQVVLTSGLCPPDVLSRAARIGRADDGSVVLAPEQPLPTAAIAKLRAAGVVVDAQMPRDSHAVRCWAEAIAPKRVAVPEIPSLVLLVTEKTSDLIDVAAELVRLGCDRQELLASDGIGVIRVVDAPTYTVVRALDREGGLRVFSPEPGNQEAVWVELGYRHPLASQLRAEPGTLLLVGSDRWRSLRDAGWLGIDAALELAVPGDRKTLAPAQKLPERRRIELRLSGGRREAPSLWVLRQGGIAMIDKLLEYLPEDVVGRLTFAASGGDAPVIVIRARTGRHAAPDLALAGAEEYAPLAHMPDVYSPAGSIVEPPLRRERLRTILEIGNGEVMWLAPLPDRKFRVERIPDHAFMPLSEWADYVLHANAPAIEPWMRATLYDFSPFVSTGLEWASGPPKDDDGDDERRAKKARPVPKQRTQPTVTEERAPQTQKQVVVQAPSVPRPVANAPVAEVQVDAELAALEAEFVALDAPGDAPERIALLDRLAVAYARLGRRRDAGLCFARAVWEAPANETAARLDAWLAADGGLAGRGALDRVLALTQPSTDDVRSIAALAARAPFGGPAAAPVTSDPHRVQRWLDDHDGDLDARTLWLSRLGLARLAGGDQLGLAHTRDRILARLAGGLPVERELPAFLRFAGRTGALGNASGEHLTKALEDLVQRYQKTKRKRSPVEAQPHLTQAYVDFQLAHGFARIGKHQRARELADEAQKLLAPVAADPVHAYLIAAYTARVEQAIGGLPPETPLPAALGPQLAALDRVGRYKIDRLREASRILEPLERPDAIGTFSKRLSDSRGQEFAELAALPDMRSRVRALGKLVDAAAASAEHRDRLIDGILDVLLELPESDAVPLLLRTHPLIAQVSDTRRALLYAEALVVAGHFGRTELVPDMMELLGAAIQAIASAEPQPDEQPNNNRWVRLERVLQQSLRALRRIGLRGEIAELLAQVERALPPTGPHVLRGRLALAAGLAYLGESERALAIFDQGRKALGQNIILPERLELTRSLALAYAQAPLANALGGIAELANLLRDITDSFGTNSHYCLSVLNFIESLVLGITSDDLALGEAGRRFVEDDEHLIRRRLHRDLGGTS